LTSPASISSAGDVNGDGLDDLIIGAVYADANGGSNAGKSYVVFGKQDNTAINLSAIAAGTIAIWISIHSTHNQIIQTIAVDITCAGD
jgi:hypothetical protein